MNKLEFVADGIIGSKQDLQNLEKLDNASILVVSDTHRNRDMLLEIVLKHGEECDALFFLGDGVADILYCIQLAFSDMHIQQKLPPLIFIVEGNIDAHNSFVFKEDFSNGFRRNFKVSINFLNFLFIKICRKTIMLSHGHISNVQENLKELAGFAKVRNCSICCYGHTHRVGDNIVDGVRMINPGCLSKHNNEASGITYALLKLSVHSETTLRIIRCL